MTTVPPDAPGASEGNNQAPGTPKVKGAKLLYLVSGRNGSAHGTGYFFADVDR